MALFIPNFCIRKRKDCKSLALIESDVGEKSFICCGENDGSTRNMEQDRFTLCVKNSAVDSIEHCDKRDLIHQAAVILSAMAIEEERNA